MRALLFRAFVALAVLAAAAAWYVGQADPAAAHANAVTGIAECLPSGEIAVEWTIANNDPHSETATYSDSVAGEVEIAGNASATVGQTLPAGTTGTRTLHVEAVWSDDFKGSADGTVELPEDCPSPPVTTLLPAEFPAFTG